MIQKDKNNNSGYCNSGNSNSGHCNSGNSNSGHWNSGNCNSGYWNSGYRNSGNCNSGDWNSGYRNSGSNNSGKFNSGHWNSGDWNSGYFNIDKPKVRMFGKETNTKREDIIFPNWFYFDLTEWISDKNMTNEQKKKHPEYTTNKGFLLTYDYKESWRISFEKAEKEDIEKTLKLPNFDYDIFEQITGINKKYFDNSSNNKNEVE